VRLVMIGPPGAGKGTQAKCLEKRYRIPHISTGEILRQAISAGSLLGREATRYMDGGGLVPDLLILDIVRERLVRPDCAPGYILDGFPRTIDQVRQFDDLLEKMGQPLDAVLSLEVRLEMFIKRLSARRVCSNCGVIYNLLTTPPRREGICDVCGAGLVQRPDDVEETIQKRFNIYEQQTSEIKKFYISKGLLDEIDGEGTVEEVHGHIVCSIEGS
jgi:adenylate kinase